MVNRLEREREIISIVFVLFIESFPSTLYSHYEQQTLLDCGRDSSVAQMPVDVVIKLANGIYFCC